MVEGRGNMDTAKLFINGRSQALRLPKAYRFEGEEVYIKKNFSRSSFNTKK